jgi:YVTN family beta-propeller protein
MNLIIRKYFWHLFLVTLLLVLPTAHAHADLIYSANSNGTVSVIDTNTDTIAATIALPAGSKPVALCLNPVSPRAYTLNANNTISVIDTANKTVISTITDAGRLTNALTIACDPTGTKVLIGNNDATDTSSNILYLNTATLALESQDTVVDNNPLSIVFNKSGANAYVLNSGAPSISVLDSATKLVTTTTPLLDSDGPSSLAIHTLDKYLYTVNTSGSSVSIFDPNTMASAKTVAVGMFPTALAVSPATNKLYVANLDASFASLVSLIDPESPDVPPTFSGDGSTAIIERNDGQRVYLASGDNIIRSYDTSTLATVPTPAPTAIPLPAGSFPNALATLTGTRSDLNLTISGNWQGTVNWPFDVAYPLASSSTAKGPEGIALTVNATANAGTCAKVDWTGCDSISGGGTLSADCTLNPLTGNKAIAAEFSKNQHFVTVSVSGGAGSSVINCSAPPVCRGDNPVCAIAADTGYALASLTDNGKDILSSVTGGVSFQIPNITTDHAIVGVFSPTSALQYSVTLAPGANGSISPVTTQTVDYGKSISFTISPNTGYHITAIGGTCGGTLTGDTYIIDPATANCSITASFAVNTYTITAFPYSGASYVAPAWRTVNHGVTAKFYAYPDAANGYHVADVSGCGGTWSGANPYLTAPATADCSITASYALNSYAITATAGTGGTISPSATVTHNNNAAFTITAATGYHINSVLVDNVPETISSTQSFIYTFNNVASAHTIEAGFEIDTFPIIATAGTNGGITPTANVNYNSNATYTATPDIGYHIGSVLVDGTLQAIPNAQSFNYTFNNVTAGHSISVTFVINSYSVTLNPVSNGVTSPPPGIQKIDYNNTGTFTLTANSGYHIDTASGCGGSLTGGTFTTGQINSDCMIDIVFVINQYSITTIAGSGGSISAGLSGVIHGTTRDITVTPDPTKSIVTVSGCGIDSSTIYTSAQTFTTSAITADCSVVASFQLTDFTITGTVAGGIGGTVTCSPALVTTTGSSTCAIAPPVGFKLANLSDNGSDVTSSVSGVSYTIDKPTGNHTVTASFVPDTFNITPIIISGSGSLDPAVLQTIVRGDKGSFKLAPAIGWKIGTASDTCGAGSASNGGLNGTTYTTGLISADCEVKVSYAINTYSITINSGANGSVAGDSSASYGDNKNYTITPAIGWHIDTVLLDNILQTVSDPLLLNVAINNITANHTLAATFAIDTFTIIATATPETGGTITPTGAVNYNDNKQVTATPASGFHISNVLIDGVTQAISDPQSFTHSFPNITANHTVTVTFAINNFTVTPTANIHGSISPTGGLQVDINNTANFTITPDAGYHIVTPLSGTCGGVLIDNTFTTDAITADCTIVAYFAIDTFAVTATVPGGNGTVTCMSPVNSGANATCTVTPASGYQLNTFTDNGTDSKSSVAGGTYNILNIAASHTIAATFNLIPPTPVSGVCGASNGGTFPTVPNANFCATGTATGITGAGPWSWNCTGTNGGTDAACNAAIRTYAIATNVSGGNGTVTCAASVNSGATATCAISAATGYQLATFADNSVDKKGSVSGSIYTITNITANHNIAVTFSLIPPTPVSGTCGASNGGTFIVAPTTGFCATGTATGVTSTGQWNWSCTGSNGGTTAACSANFQTYAVTATVTGGNGAVSCTSPFNSGATASCRVSPASGYQLGTFTDNGADSKGSVTGSTYTIPNITANHDIAATFSLIPVPISGACGSSNGAIFSVAPTTGLCTSGAATGVAGAGPWIWSCNGSNGGVDAHCSASIQTYAITATTDGNGSVACTSPVKSGATSICAISPETGYELATLTDNGTNSKSSVAVGIYSITSVTATHAIAATFSLIPATAVNGACGSSNGGIFAVAPTANFCATGTATVVTGSGPWSWSCNGSNGGTNAACSASIPTYAITATTTGGNGTVTCSSPVNSGSPATCTVTPASGYELGTLTDNGSDSKGSVAGGIYSITSVTANHAIAATFSLIPATAVNGACGTSNGGIFSVAPTANFCSTGTATVVTGTGPWNWDCNGSNGGTNAACSANIPTYAITATTTGGNGTVTCTSPVNSGATASCSVSPASGYQLATFTDNGTNSKGSVTSGIYTLSNVAADHAISATFSLIPAIVSGACGASNGSAFTVAPATGFCASGTATSVTGAGPWSWSCTGSNGGTNAACSATIRTFTLADALQALRIAVKVVTPNPDELLWLDVAPLAAGKPKGDGVVDITDALVLLKHSIGSYTAW